MGLDERSLSRVRSLVNYFEPMSHRAWRSEPFTSLLIHSSMLIGKIIHHSGHRILLLKAEAFHLRNVMLKSDFNRANPPIRGKFCIHADPNSLKHLTRYGMGSSPFSRILDGRSGLRVFTSKYANLRL
jgi:hypothetical protein